MNKNGFTLLELVVVMAIISIMSAVVISGYGNQRDSKALFLGKSQVINDIGIIRGETYNKGGYGIRFTKDSDKYMIFADLDNDGIYDGAGEDYEEIKLPRNIKVSDLEKDKDGVITNPASVDVAFQSPYGKALIDGEEKTDGDNFINLEIEITNGSNTKTIKVSSSRPIE